MTRFDLRSAKRHIERFDTIDRQDWIRRFVHDFGPSDSKLSRDIDKELKGDERHEIEFEGRQFQVVINRQLERVTIQERLVYVAAPDLAA